MAIMIRLAVPSDVGDIASLHVRAWQSAYRGHMPDAYLAGLNSTKRVAIWSAAIGQPDTQILVATAGQTLIGFCSLLPSRDAGASRSVGEIAAIYVEPSHWRVGVGSSLLHAIIDSARGRGFSEVTLWVLTSNASARAFYEARGFESDHQTKIDHRPDFSIHETRYRRIL